MRHAEKKGMNGKVGSGGIGSVATPVVIVHDARCAHLADRLLDS